METRVSSDLEAATALLEADEVVAIPTETVYGLAANATSPQAVEKVFRLKARPASDPLIVHVRDAEAVEELGIAVPLWARRLMSLFWPGPLTLLLPKSERIAPQVSAGLPHLAFRAPAHPLTQELLKRLPFPLAAPSANPFGHTSPTTAEHVRRYFEGQIPLILEGGPCQAGIESTIIGEEKGRFILYRPGAIPREQIEEALGEKLHARPTTSVPKAPGQFTRHYAPKKPLLYGWKTPPIEANASLIFLNPPEDLNHPYLHSLSLNGTLQEAAHTLYATLHQCDQEPTEFILVQQIPSTGLGEALHDRLHRAHARSVFTIRHSNHSWGEFLALLRRYEIGALVDIRKQPYSRYVPHFSQGPLQKSLHEANIAYEWQPLPKKLPSTLSRALQEYLHVVILCAEGEPHRCHRFQLSDQLKQEGFTVLHILPEGGLRLHHAPISLELGEKI